MSTNINSMDRAFKDTQKTAPITGKYEMGTIAPSMAGRSAFSVKSNKQTTISSEERIDQICALFKTRTNKLKALQHREINEVAQAVEDMLLATSGVESVVAEQDEVNLFLSAIKKGYVCSEGFESSILNKNKVYYVPANQRDSIYLKSASGVLFYGGMKAITNFSLASLAAALDINKKELQDILKSEPLASDRLKAKSESKKFDAFTNVCAADTSAVELATTFSAEGVSVSNVKAYLSGTVNEPKTNKVLALMKVMAASE